MKKRYREEDTLENRLEILKQMREGKDPQKTKKKGGRSKKVSRMWRSNGQMVLGDRRVIIKTLRANAKAAKEEKERDEMVNRILGIDIN